MRTKKKKNKKKKNSSPFVITQLTNIAGRLHMSMPGLALLIPMALSVMLIFLSYHGPLPINGDDNYIYMNYAAMVHFSGISSLAQGGVLSTKYLLILGMASMYAIFGPGVFAATVFESLCAVVAIFAIYKIGSEIYGKGVGLLAASLCSFFPLVVVEAAIIGDDIPMMAATSLAMMFFVLAIKRKNKMYYVLAGFVATLGELIVAESLIIIIPMVAIWAYLAARGRIESKLKSAASFASGISVAVFIIIFFSYLASGNPFYSVTVSEHWYSTYGAATVPYLINGMEYYLSTMLPFNQFFGYYGHTSAQGVSFFGGLIMPNYISSIVSSRTDFFLYGYFFYAAIAAIIYLAIKIERRAFIPLVWFAFSFLYLVFGSQSLSAYIQINQFTRFTAIFVPALTLLIAMALVKAYSALKKRHRAVSISFVVVVVAVLFAESIFLISYMSNSMSHSPIAIFTRGIAAYMETLPNGTIISVPGAFTLLLPPYMNYHRINFEAPVRHHSLPNNPIPQYVVMAYNGNQSIIKNASELAYKPINSSISNTSLMYEYNLPAENQNISVYRIK